MKNVVYLMSLLILGISIFLIIEYPNWQRMQLIAGVLIAVGFIANIIGYSTKQKIEVK